MAIKRKTEAVWIENSARWQIKIQVRGKRRTFYSLAAGRKGKIEAERKADEWLDGGASDDPRLEALWQDFLADAKSNTGVSNYKKHESIGRVNILPALGLRRVSSITLQDMQDCINAAHKRGLAKKSLSNIRASLSSVYAYARRGRIKMESPDGLVIPRDATVGERRILQPADIHTLFSVDYITRYGRSFRCHYIHAWRFAVLTGLRPGELYGLRWEDVAEGVTRIKRAYNVDNELTKGKNDNARRWFATPARAEAILADQKAAMTAKGLISPWVFADEHGGITEQRHAARLWRTYRKQHSIASSPYEMRHTMISIVSADLPEKLLKASVGHGADMDTLRVYAHQVTGEMARAQEIIDCVYDRIFSPWG